MKFKHQIKVLIIEDDPVWSVYVESIIAESKYQLLGSANTMKQAKAMIEGLKPDVLICDIQIQNTKIFELVENDEYNNIPKIFMTNHLDDKCYDSSVDIPKSTFLAKPFHKLTLIATLDLLLQTYPIKQDVSEKYITVRGKQQQLKKIPYSKIYWIQAEGNYSLIYIKDAKYVKKQTLKDFESELDDSFLRIHKSYLINKSYIQRIDLGNHHIIVADTVVPIGRAYRKNLDTLLETI